MNPVIESAQGRILFPIAAFCICCGSDNLARSRIKRFSRGVRVFRAAVAG
jgi:hypothetical protein